MVSRKGRRYRVSTLITFTTMLIEFNRLRVEEKKKNFSTFFNTMPWLNSVKPKHNSVCVSVIDEIEATDDPQIIT